MTGTFPAHGPIACRRCFQGIDDNVLDVGPWRAINDPGAWGSADPRILILGFSKGRTQADAYVTGRFEDVPFRGMRDRLEASLRLLKLMEGSRRLDELFRASERDFAFGSLVRCSLSRLNGKGRRECTGPVMPRAFVEQIGPTLRRCADTWLTDLPGRLETVVMLGTGDAYIKSCRKLVQSLHPSDFASVNDVAYRTGRITWVHVAHPSPLNGHHPNWMRAESVTESGRKCLLAQEAIQVVSSSATLQ